MADRLSQEAIEALYSTTSAKSRLSQEAVEVLEGIPAHAQVSQYVVQVLFQPGPYSPRNPAINHQNPAVL